MQPKKSRAHRSLQITVITIIILIYFFTRLYHLMDFPIFNDEAIYARWAQLAYRDPGERFISLTDGKQPLFIWMSIPMVHIFINPLLATRLTSVVMGFASVIGVGILTFLLSKNKWTAYCASFLITIYPFALILDRMGLYESLLGTITIWTLIVGIWLVAHPSLGLSFIFAHILAAGLLTKTTAAAHILLSPLFLLTTLSNTVSRFKLTSYISFSIFLALCYSSVLFLAPHIKSLFELQGIYSYTADELKLINIVSVFTTNIQATTPWLITYLTFPFIVLAGFGMTKTNISYKFKLSLALWALIPFIGINIVGKMLYPRYLFHITLPLIPLVAHGFIHTVSSHTPRIKIAGILVASALMMYWVTNDFLIVTDMARAFIPPRDREQYINGWPSGAGLKEIIAYLSAESIDKQIVVYSEGTYGSLPTTTLTLYLGDNPNIIVKPIDPIPSVLPDEIVQSAGEKPTYVLLNRDQTILQWPAEKVLEFQKGSGDSYMRFYEIRATPVSG